MSAEVQLVIQVGEHYLYQQDRYQVVDIIANTVQLRSLRRSSDIIFQSYERLLQSWQRGNFVRIQEAPLKGAANKIVAGLSHIERTHLDRRTAYTLAVETDQHGKLPINETRKLIDRVAQRIGDTHPPSYSALYVWNRKFKISGGSPIALIPKPRKHKNRLGRQHIETQETIIKTLDQLYYKRPPASLSDVIDAIQEKIKMINRQRIEHFKIPSKTTLWRIISELDTYTKELHQLGYREASKHQKWSKRTPQSAYLLQYLECDTHVVDLELVDDQGVNVGKCYLTVVLELKSRRVIGYDLSFNPPSLEKTLRALKMSLSKNFEYNGLGSHYKVDNGPDFIAELLADKFHLLGAKMAFCAPGSPDQKPHVEKWFDTFEEQLPHIMKGTTYSNPRECGDYKSAEHAIYTLERFQQIFSNWLEKIYHQSPHFSLNGLSPTVVWNEHLDPVFPPRKFSDEDIHQLFLSKTTATPSNGRLRFNNLQWTLPAVPFLGTQGNSSPDLDLYYDISELGYAWTCHPKNPEKIFKLEAVDPEYQCGLTMSTHEEIHRKLLEKAKTFDFSSAKQERLLLIEECSQATKRSEKQMRKKMKESVPPSSASQMPSHSTDLAMPLNVENNVPSDMEVMQFKPHPE